MTELVGYYRDRAAEYDSVYDKPERQEDLSVLRGAVARLVDGASVLEIAAGTGYWTQVMSASAATITATDLNTETLDVARAREYGPAAVAFRRADAYALDAVPGRFDTAFIGFFWSHVLRADVPRFIGGVCNRLRPGARVIVVDNRYVPGSSTPISRTTEAGDTYQRRVLNDGRDYEIVKNFPAREQFASDVADVVAQADGRSDGQTGTHADGPVEWTQLRYYWLAACLLR